MIDLSKKVLPDSVTVSGRTYRIKTDFQYWILFVTRLQGKELKLLTDCDFLYDGEIPEDRQKGFEALCAFAFPKRELPRPLGGGSAVPFDYTLDSDLIYAAFLEQYGIDLVNPSLSLHWHKFRALFDGLHSTKLNEVMGYRLFDENDRDDWKKSMTKLRDAWEIRREIPLTDEERKILDDFNSRLK